MFGDRVTDRYGTRSLGGLACLWKAWQCGQRQNSSEFRTINQRLFLLTVLVILVPEYKWPDLLTYLLKLIIITLQKSVVPLWIFKNPKILLWKIPRLNKNSQAILKIPGNGENENTNFHKYREKNILLRLHSDIVSELLTDRIQIWKSSDNVNSRSDDIIGLIVLDLRSQTIRCQNYTQKILFYSRQ